MSDEWRVEVHLQDEGHGLTLGDRLRSLDLDDEARKRLGERVIVTRDGSRMFLYTGSEHAAELADRVRELSPAEPEMHVEPAPGSLPHPAFVVIGGRTPGIARDLGL